jgi:PAS domain S-box-containing protein
MPDPTTGMPGRGERPRVQAGGDVPTQDGAPRDAATRAALDGARLAAILEHQQELICRFLPDTTLTFVNNAYARFFGAQKSALLGRRWIEFLPPDARSVALTHVEQVAAGGQAVTYEHEVVGPDGTIHWQEWIDHPVIGEDGQVVELQSVGRDVTERHRERERLRFLLGELDHRVKNQLAVIQAIARATLREHGDPADFVPVFLGRIDALARTHEALARSGWLSVDLAALVRGTLAPFRTERWSIEGPLVQLPVRSTQPIAMALHELATNASKYGSLSTPGGRVDVRWTYTVEACPRAPGDVDVGAGVPVLELCWRESGGPPADTPGEPGLGLRLVSDGLAYELGGAVTLDFRASGLDARLRVPLRPAPSF